MRLIQKSTALSPASRCRYPPNLSLYSSFSLSICRRLFKNCIVNLLRLKTFSPKVQFPFASKEASWGSSTSDQDAFWTLPRWGVQVWEESCWHALERRVSPYNSLNECIITSETVVSATQLRQFSCICKVIGKSCDVTVTSSWRGELFSLGRAFWKHGSAK